MAVHTSPGAIAKNADGTARFAANPDWHFAATFWVKCDLTDVKVDLNDLLGSGDGPHHTPEELLDILARDVLSVSGRLDPDTGESNYPELSTDKVKRLILLCALTPDNLLSNEEAVARCKALRNKYVKRVRDKRINELIKYDDERAQASS